MIYINGEAVAPVIVDDTEINNALAEIVGEVEDDE